MNPKDVESPLLPDIDKILEAVANEYARQAQAVGFSEDDKFLTIAQAHQAIKSEIIRMLEGLKKETNTYSNDGDFSDDAPRLVEAIPTSKLNDLIRRLSDG